MGNNNKTKDVGALSKRLYSVSEIAEELDVKTYFVIQLSQKGAIDYQTEDSRIKITQTELDRLKKVMFFIKCWNEIFYEEETKLKLQKEA